MDTKRAYVDARGFRHLTVALKECLDALDHPLRVNSLRLEFLHIVK
jgi:hypothetical protein